MKVVVSLEFNSQEEAAAYLGGKTSTPKTASDPAPAPAKAKAKAAEAPAPAAPKFDRDAALAEVTDIFSVLLKDPATGKQLPKAAERQAVIIGLISKQGGQLRAGTVPDAKFPAFLAELRTYASGVSAEVQAEEAPAESLI